MRDFHGSMHELKTWPQYYDQLRQGVKQFELRKDDREYRVDDLLILREYDPLRGVYTGYSLCAVVTCIVRGDWLATGYVALGIRVLQ